VVPRSWPISLPPQTSQTGGTKKTDTAEGYALRIAAEAKRSIVSRAKSAWPSTSALATAQHR